MANAIGKRGRPVGSKTTTETLGKKRARDYMDIDMPAAKAASVVAEKYGIPEFQVFKDFKRHGKSIIDATMHEYEASKIGPPKPPALYTSLKEFSSSLLPIKNKI